ncbi:hypothetical protein BGZ50_007125 [Haplosporangium sp. Z 11]|nr:hypothetical protein BGZ50_007125 [Haplosporangium sp. Z 11]
MCSAGFTEGCWLIKFYKSADKQHPNGLANATLREMDTDFHGGFYMLSNLFADWLWELDWDMLNIHYLATRCICNCIIEVPTLSEYQKTRSRSLGVKTLSDQINHLQEELMKRYAGNKEVIACQKDFSVLNYLSIAHNEGSTRAIVELVHQIVNREEYEGIFMELNEDAFVDEDSFDDISSGEGSDSDYEDMRLVANDQEMQMVVKNCGTMERERNWHHL